MNKKILLTILGIAIVIILAIIFKQQIKTAFVQQRINNIPQDIPNNTNLPASIAGTTKIGAHIVLSPGASIDDEIAVLKSLGATYTRVNVGTSNWPTMSKVYDRYVQSGIKVLLNVAWQSSTTGNAFPTDMELYASKLTAILDTLASKPELIVIENEEINKAFHSGPMSDYITELKTASPIVHSYGLKVTNGGVYGQGLDTMVYRYLKEKYGQTFAETNFGNYVFLPVGLRAANNPGSAPVVESNIANIQLVLDAAPYLDYINIHHYEVDNPNVDEASATTATPNVLKYTKEYIETTTGKPIMSNETSVRNNTQPALVTALLQDYVDNNFPYAIWWDNIDGNKYGGIPLNDGKTPFALRSTGQAFKDFISEKQ